MNTPAVNASVVDKLFAAMQKAKGIPALEETVGGILSSLRDVQRGTRDLASQISEDFSMTQKVLKLANSAMYAPFASGVASISSALNVLGADALLHLVLGASMITAAELKDDESLSRTLLASELARAVGADRQEDVSIAALMFDTGKLLARRFLPDEAAAIDRKIDAGESEDAAAVAVLGMRYAELGAEVAKRWKLPGEIVSIIDGTGDPTLVNIARFSTQASALIHSGDAQAVHDLVMTLNVPGVDTSRLTHLISSKLEEIVPAVKLTSSSGPEVMLRKLHAGLIEEKKASIEELTSAMFPQLALSLDAAHCLLFMMTRSGEFVIRSGYGKGIEELKSKLRLTAEFKPTAFHAAIKNNVDVMIADATRLKPANLPDGYRTLLPATASFLILPVASSRVLGLLYLDWGSPQSLNQETMATIRDLRDIILTVFPH